MIDEAYRWSTWSGNCPTVSVNAFPQPIPPNVFVPGWAYLDVKANDTFNETAAKLSANSTAESTALQLPTSTSISIAVVPATNTEPATVSATSTASASTSSTTRDNAIMGGIVGGTVGLAILLGFAHWYFTRRRRLARLGTQLPSPIEEPHRQEPETADMRQYLANTAPRQLAPSSISTSLASPTSAQFSNLSASGSIRSEAPLYV
ncbi:hypothetical protein D9615_004082 [Tricholomella constricta]|uniref:Uncharacterized protein n=1 Tax=Tricholomella constricta TaxID=117010 RepID=A0A8H5HCK6_9AGAR|nr:hypothetical protein D9615_004082 [Tricholomella constricta]